MYTHRLALEEVRSRSAKRRINRTHRRREAERWCLVDGKTDEQWADHRCESKFAPAVRKTRSIFIANTPRIARTSNGAAEVNAAIYRTVAKFGGIKRTRVGRETGKKLYAGGKNSCDVPVNVEILKVSKRNCRYFQDISKKYLNDIFCNVLKMSIIRYLLDFQDLDIFSRMSS